MRIPPLASVLALALAAVAGCASAPPTPGAPVVEARTVEYRDGEDLLVGRLALPADLDPAWPRPVVLVVHEWWGRTPHADRSAERLAALGWVALAVDVYGEGRSTDDPRQAGAWAGRYRQDPAAAVARLQAALAFLRTVPGADLSRVACIGFCFGGTVSLGAAWAGMDLRAAVSFHGNLTTPSPEQAPGVGASILVLHGADDPFVPEEAVDAFQTSMRENGFDWEFVALGGAVHSFTSPEADGSFNPGAKYHETAARRAWEAAAGFLAERLR